jgi:hypothetical protein
MQQQQQQQHQAKVNLDDLTDGICTNCAKKVFVQVVTLKHASPLVSPTGKEHTFIIPAGFMCVECEAIYGIKEAKVEEKKKVTLN